MGFSVGIFYSTAVFCLGASVVAHLLAPVLLREPSLALWRLDSYGICVLIGGSWLPGLVFGFRCRPGARLFYTIDEFHLLKNRAVLARMQVATRPHHPQTSPPETP